MPALRKNAKGAVIFIQRSFAQGSALALQEFRVFPERCCKSDSSLSLISVRRYGAHLLSSAD